MAPSLIWAKLDPVTGEQSLRRVVTVMEDEEIENDATQTNLATAKLDHPEAEIGYEISTPLPPLEFGRVQAQMSKQIIMGKIRDADRVGEIINGIVKRVEYGHIIVDLGRAEGVIRRDQALPRENVKGGDRIRAYALIRNSWRSSLLRKFQKFTKVLSKSLPLPATQGHALKLLFILMMALLTLSALVLVCAVHAYRLLSMSFRANVLISRSE